MKHVIFRINKIILLKIFTKHSLREKFIRNQVLDLVSNFTLFLMNSE